MHTPIRLLLSLAVAFTACVSSLRADTTIFENGFFFISAPEVFDDVVVGEGAIVAFTDGVIIEGDLEVVDGGFVSANDTLIEGNVKANGAAIVDLLRATVDGNVQIKKTGGDPVLGLLPLISIINSDIGGNVSITNNNVNGITVTGNDIGGKLEVRRNQANSITVSGNRTNLNPSLPPVRLLIFFVSAIFVRSDLTKKHL